MKRAAHILSLALAFPLVLSAQQSARVEHGPGQRLLAHRAELSLTADQVRKLEAIDSKYDKADQEVVAKLETLRGKPVGQPLRMRDMAPADREKLLAHRAELQPLMQQLRSSHQAQIAELRGVLSAEQNTKANEYLYQGPGQGPGRGPAAGSAGMRGRGGMQGAGRGMMRQAPVGAGQGFRGGRGIR